MKYEKPELTELSSAVSMIECSGKKQGLNTDCPGFMTNKTASAYEADE